MQHTQAGQLLFAIRTKLKMSLQVSAVLAYSHENAVEPFLEPVLALSQALLEKDQQDMHRNMDGK